MSLTACPFCGVDDDAPIPDEPLFAECLDCGGWFVTRSGRVDYEGTQRLLDAMPDE